MPKACSRRNPSDVGEGNPPPTRSRNDILDRKPDVGILPLHKPHKQPLSEPRLGRYSPPPRHNARLGAISLLAVTRGVPSPRRIVGWLPVGIKRSSRVRNVRWLDTGLSPRDGRLPARRFGGHVFNAQGRAPAATPGLFSSRTFPEPNAGARQTVTSMRQPLHSPTWPASARNGCRVPTRGESVQSLWPRATHKRTR